MRLNATGLARVLQTASARQTLRASLAIRNLPARPQTRDHDEAGLEVVTGKRDAAAPAAVAGGAEPWPARPDYFPKLLDDLATQSSRGPVGESPASASRLRLVSRSLLASGVAPGLLPTRSSRQ